MQGRGGLSSRVLWASSVACLFLACESDGDGGGDGSRGGVGGGAGESGGSGTGGMSDRGGTAGSAGDGGTDGDAGTSGQAGGPDDAGVSGGGAGGSVGGTGGDSGAAGEDGGAAGDSGSGGTGGRPITTTESCAAREDETRWAAGQTLFVDDDPACGGREPCFPLIQNAMYAASDGDTIVVLPGTHWGVDMDQETGLSNLRITSLEGPATTFISEYCMKVIGREHDPGEIWIDGFTFRECGPRGITSDYGWGVHVTTGNDADVRIQDNVFEGTFTRGGVGLWSSTVGTRFRATVARNRFSDHHGEESAIDIELPADFDEDYCIRVENNVITGSDSAINIRYSRVRSGTGRFEVANNTLYGNELAVPLLGSSSVYTFVNNVLFGNTEDFKYYEESDVPLDIRNNLIGGGQFTGLNGNFSADPLFEDAEAGDFRLRGASPAADRGDVRHTALDDITRTPRTDPPDLGAYERVEHAGELIQGLRCGDGIVQRGSVLTAQGTFRGFEACDDGNARDGDGCSSLCQFEPAPARGLIGLVDTHLCVLRGNGNLACWGEDREVPPTGPFRQLALSAYHGCALRDDGSVACWDPQFPAAPPFTPTGTFTQIDGDYNDTCGLRPDGSITCWDEDAITVEQRGPHARVDTYYRVCGLSSKGVVTCFPPYTSFPTGPFLEVFPTNNSEGCGLRLSGQVACVPALGQVFDYTPRAGFARVTMDARGQACGIRPDGRAVRWDGAGVERPMKDDLYVEAAPEFDLCCGLTADRRAWCSENVYGLPAE